MSKQKLMGLVFVAYVAAFILGLIYLDLKTFGTWWTIVTAALVSLILVIAPDGHGDDDE